MTKIIISILFFTSSAMATCPKDVQYLEKGQQTPCEGYLFSPQKEFEIRYKVKTYDLLQDINKDQEDIIKLMNERTALIENRNIQLLKELDKKDRLGFWENTLYFSLGAILTGIIAKNVK